MKESHAKAIKEILDSFDFEKVRTYMHLVGWKYFDTPGVPSIQRLRETAEELLQNAANRGEGSWACGGFKASFFEGGEESPQLSLDFIAVHKEVYI